MRIDRTQIRLPAHNDLSASASNYGSTRHSYLRHDCSDIASKHLVQVVDDRLGGSNAATWGMENQIKSLQAIQLVYGGHKTVLVAVIDLPTSQTRLLEPP